MSISCTRERVSVQRPLPPRWYATERDIMFRKTSVEVKVCETLQEAIAEARALNANGQTANERALNLTHVRKIQDAIVHGETRPFDWAIGTVPSLELTSRVNGHHSSNAFLALDALSAEEQAKIPMPIHIIYTTYTCDTAEDLPVLYMQFDPNWTSRNKEDYIGAFMANRPELMETTTRVSNKYATAGLLWYLQKAEGFSGRSAREQYHLVLENDEIQHFLEFCGKDPGLDLNRHKREMNQRVVVAAMYHTTRHGTEDDRDFWKRVSGGRSSFGRDEEDSQAAKLAAFLEHTRDRLYDWPGLKARFKNNQAPNELEIFATCLRLFASYKKGTVIGEAVVLLKNQDVTEIIRRLYPLPELVAA
jgi:hypothetical protein